MRDVTLGDFRGSEGASFDVEAGGRTLALELQAVEELPHSPREGGGFRLEFLGPPDPILPQAIYPFRRGADAFEIFIVPIAREAGGLRYEAVFF